jgi:DNA-3-methyladenine glycosylase I
MSTYCEYIRDHPEDILNSRYHNLEYGFPLQEDARLFERLVLEINQAGLSWNTILKKKENFELAYAGFDIDKVAAFDDPDRSRLLKMPGSYATD